VDRIKKVMLIPLLIAHRARLICEALSSLVAQADNFSIVGCATTRQETEQLLPQARVLLLDSGLGGSDILAFLWAVHHLHPHVKVIVAGVEDRPEAILRYLEAGAAGYVLATEGAEAILPRLYAAAQGEAHLSPRVTALVIRRLKTLRSTEASRVFGREQLSRLYDLTPRQRDVLQLLATGLSNEEIAARLFLECGTVKNHVHHILQRLDLESRREAADLYRLQQRYQHAFAGIEGKSAAA
jgi:DNA-binding NarL/FixJ family response regulator